MQIVFNIAEDSNVELLKGEYELVQGECCVTELKFNFPETIRGVAIGNYTKRIEFGECKDLGECVKFIDDINGDTYELKENATAFNKIMVQLVLTYQKITWKTIPVVLEFHESVNASGNAVIQAQILSLSAIEREWENFIKANTFRVISRVADIPTADASSLGDTIFYLGANTDTAPLLTYGHYYRCNNVNGVYEWTDLTQDASLAGVANGIREINKNQTLQFWAGTTDELENEVPQENVGYIATDRDIRDVLKEYVPDIIVNKAINADMSAHANRLNGLINVYDILQSLNSPFYYYTENLDKCGLYVIRFVNQNSGDESAADEDAKQAFLLVTDLFVKARASEYNIFYNAETQRIESTSQAYRIVSVYRICGILDTVYARVVVGELLSEYDGIGVYEMALINGVISVGNTLVVNGYTARVTQFDEETGLYNISCVKSAFAMSSGDEITVEVRYET